MEFVGLIGVFFAVLWLVFLITASRFMHKQREANRQIVARLEAIESQMKNTNQLLESANKMHGDLNRAAQWLIDNGQKRKP
jgi:F0F1-type ATP synthase membrane subunit b/b'